MSLNLDDHVFSLTSNSGRHLKKDIAGIIDLIEHLPLEGAVLYCTTGGTVIGSDSCEIGSTFTTRPGKWVTELGAEIPGESSQVLHAPLLVLFTFEEPPEPLYGYLKFDVISMEGYGLSQIWYHFLDTADYSGNEITDPTFVGFSEGQGVLNLLGMTIGTYQSFGVN